jgi:peptide/nickel transport system ATP-binding protein
MTGEPARAAGGDVLAVRDLHVAYRTRAGVVQAVKGVSFAIAPGRLLSVVGESGSGKSTLALAVLGALGAEASVTGSVRYRGDDLFGMTPAARRKLWGRRLAMVFQDPGGTLNPVLPVGEQVTEVLREHEGFGRADARRRMLKLFEAVNLPDPATLARRYPHQLSGGQQQRVSIAIALACDPDVLILDEPTTGLDVTTEARILDLVADLRRRSGAAILYITHNLGVVARLGDEVAVMYAGEVVEHGPVRTLFARPRHPYTLALIECLPHVERRAAARLLPAIPGFLPDPTSAPASCQFAPRCAMAQDRCGHARPDLAAIDGGHRSRCFFWETVPPPSTGEATSVAGTDASASGVATAGASPLLQATDLSHRYGPGGGWLAGPGAGGVRALDGVDLTVRTGETLAVVGESGSGKTTLARCLVGLIQPTGGTLRLDGGLYPRRAREWTRVLRRRIQMVFQNPDRTLNARRTILDAVARPLELFGLADRATRRARSTELLRAVGLGERHLDLYPGQISGGERQRVAIARAFACRPDLVVCDEPTSALDVSVQATVLNLLVELQRRARTSYVFISHDLSVVRHIADRVVVLYRGQVCEAGLAEAVFAPPYHPYTEALLSAVPAVARPEAAAPIRLETGGAESERGCPFQARCPRKLGRVCEETAPPLLGTPDTHALACHIPREELARVQRDAAGWTPSGAA